MAGAGGNGAVGSVIDLAGGTARADIPRKLEQVVAINAGFFQAMVTMRASLPVVLDPLAAAGTAGPFLDFLQ